MNKIFTKVVFMFSVLLATGFAVNAQSIVVSGTITDKATREPIPGVSVTVKGKTFGASTDGQGKFSFTTTENTPLTLLISYVGFTPLERVVSGSTANLTFELETGTILGQEVVISASRTPERILESPVSIERLSAAQLKESPAPSFYDALMNMKGVEMSAQSLTFKSINTRGFNSNGNVRFNQFIDGMDNQAPGLNFSVGNIVGMTELDVDNVELLPGASSALYGAGGINGTLLMTSKDPFKYQGASYQYKTGINHVNDDNSSVQPFNQLDVRVAKSWNNKFGIKGSFSFLQAKDWIGSNSSNFDRVSRTFKSGDRSSDTNYDGVNIYGDELSQNMRNVAQSVVAQGTRAFVTQFGLATGGLVPSQTQINSFLASNPQTQASFVGLSNGLIPNQNVTRNGYREQDLVDYDAKSLKASGALHYKFTNTIEGIFQANWGTGTSVYTGTDRYSLRNFSIGQYKLELKGQDFMIRGYTTQERSGDSYISSILGSYINEKSKSSRAWFPEYVGNYVGARAGGQPDAQAHAFARTRANSASANGSASFQPGTPQFDNAKNEIMNTTISASNPAANIYGAKFDDKTNLYHYEGLYNFSNALKNVVEFQVGASYRLYDLNSAGTIFDDLNRSIDIEEYGAFAQVGKKLLNEKLKLTFSGRYDKSQNFEGRFTPRITGVLTVAKNNNIRASFQTGFRNPTTQNQYLDLSVGGGTQRLIGGLPEILTKYNLYGNTASTDVSYRAYLNALATGSTGAASVALLRPYTFDAVGVRPESVQSFELGYKGLITSNLLIDAYGYYSTYKDFISSVEIYQNTGTNTAPNFVKFGVPVNVAGAVETYGAALGIDYLIGKYNLSGNVSYNEIGDLPANYLNEFNTPNVRYNLGFGNKEIVKNFGFNINYRWQDNFYWNSSFASGDVPAFSTVDAQINLKVPSINSMFKIGGSNIMNKYYLTSYGNPEIGAMYYASISFNP